jgi:glycosyltransferase involved in cell wall biosynthesis
VSDPRVLFVGRTRYRLPLEGPLAAKWDALSARLDLRVLASGTGSDPRFRLFRPRPLEGPLFYATLPARVARELRSFDPDAIAAESAFEAVACELARIATRSRARLIVEVHGDWRTSTRLYGSRARGALGPLADLLATWAVRRADGWRAVSEFTASFVRELGGSPEVFPAYTDLRAFDGPVEPVPVEPRAVFVGVLERYKNVEGLAAAWRLVAARMPEARLHVVGDGPQAEVAAALDRAGATWERRLSQADVARALDASRALVLPSESEGLPRVVIEAFLRGRPVVATRAGGTPEIVEDGTNGLLVPRGDPDALATALGRVLADRDLAQRLGDAARASAARWLTTPEAFADRFRKLVDGVLAG